MADLPSASLVLGGGCFWCTDAAYRLLPGVTEVTCGYAGGHTERPTYEAVCSGATGHAEVVRIEYDPARIGPRELLDYFWRIHDPTQVGGQGADTGTQYRSVILYGSEAQCAAATASRAGAQARFAAPISTEIAPLDRFWPAEARHQDYFRHHPESGYCRAVIAPKIGHLRRDLG
ncbi:MAG: peptide-methionine (S)-S-oxide reductase MsrA [Opitutaceae bacterium]